MPFINDVLDENQKQIDDGLARKKQAVATRFLFEPEAISEELKQLLIGQDDVIDQLENLLFRVKADLVEPNRPLLVVLLLGPTGVGKTQLVNHLARLILGSEKSLCRIDMNTLSQSHYSAALTGAPPGYAGSKENHTLFDIDAVTGSYSRPGIVLFDEIEKASNEVCRSLLNVLDNAELTLSSGNKTINFSNSLVFMTSNLGSDALLKQHNMASTVLNRLTKKGRYKDKKTASNAAFKSLQAHFDPEFLNRIEEILSFNAIGSKDIVDLIKLEQNRMNKRIKTSGYHFVFDKSCIARLKKEYKREFGARNIAHRIRCDIEPRIARILLNPLSKSGGYVVAWKKTMFEIQPATLGTSKH